MSTLVFSSILSALSGMAVADPAPRLDCLGNPRSKCEEGMTGPACDFPCVEGASCDYDLICHSWGATYGVSAYGAYLFPCEPNWPEWLVAKLSLLFIAQHESSFSLAPGLALTDLGLTPAPLFRASAGKLNLYRFTQSYRGLPVFGPDRLVTVVTNYQGAVAVRGAVIDARVPYLHAETQASKTLAKSSARLHASQLTGIAVEQLDVTHLFLVAVPRAEAIGWAATVVQGLNQVATVVVEADPAEQVVLPLLHFSPTVIEGLEDSVEVTVRTEDLNSEITMGQPSTGVGIDTVDTNQLFDMTPLLGSTQADQFRLGTERVVVYDASEVMAFEELGGLPVVAAEDPSFLASPGTSTFRAQSHFFFISNAFARTDTLMAGKWESLLPLLDIQSVIPAAEFRPRAMIYTDASSTFVCPEAPACVNLFLSPFAEPDTVPAEYEQPPGTQPFEGLALMYLKNANNIPTVAHEFGHVVDLFAHAGFIDLGVQCTGKPGCSASCVEDTTNEAPPLRETFASLVAIWLGRELTAVGQDATNCSYLPTISTGGSASPHNQACRPEGSPFPRLIRDDDPSCPADNLCDKPSIPGFFSSLPTGACSDGGPEGGYRVNSLFQAFWEALHAQTCSETPPYTCQPLTALAQAGDSGDVLGGALLYAARVNSMTYKGFVGDMATYIACNFGEDVYFEFNQVACHHGLRACDAGVPLSCEVCGDNQRQGGEECDGGDLGENTCTTLGFAGGVLLCGDSCQFDTTMCDTSASTGDESGVPTGGPTSGPAPTGGDATSAMTGPDETTTSGPGDDGCDCRTNTRSPSLPGWLLAGALLARRGRPRKTGLAAGFACCLLTLPGTGCSPGHEPGASTAAETGTSSGETTGTGDDTDSASGSSGPNHSSRLVGVYHSKRYTHGLKWEQPPYDDDVMALIWWGNVLIEPDSSLRLERYFCGGLLEVQSFAWEPDGEGIRVVPPDGEGTPFKWSADEVSAVSIRPGELCGEILLEVHAVGAEDPYPPETYSAGHLCTTNVSPTSCEFEFRWCDGPPAPPVCE